MINYSDYDLQLFSQEIENRKKETEEILSGLLDTLESYRAELRCSDVVDRACLSYNVDSTLAQICRTRRYLSDLERANSRIVNKTYGRCQYTGELIPKERLLVNPTASCIVEIKKR